MLRLPRRELGSGAALLRVMHAMHAMRDMHHMHGMHDMHVMHVMLRWELGSGAALLRLPLAPAFATAGLPPPAGPTAIPTANDLRLLTRGAHAGARASSIRGRRAIRRALRRQPLRTTCACT